MSVNDNVERRLADYYAGDAPQRAPGRVLDLALEAVERTQQRRSFTGAPWRVRPPSPIARLAVALLVVIALGGLGVTISRLSGGPGAIVSPPPSPTISPSPSPTLAQPPPSAAPIGTITETSGALEAGTYRLGPEFPVSIQFAVPDGWVACYPDPVEQGVCLTDDTFEPGVTFSIIENVVADPCGSALMDPPVGPSVDDLVTAISHMQGFQATVPVDMSVDGYSGKQFDLTAPGPASGCDLMTWATSDRTNGVSAGEVNVLRVIDVDGVRVLIAGAYHPGLGPPDSRAQVEAVLDTVSIGS